MSLRREPAQEPQHRAFSTDQSDHQREGQTACVPGSRQTKLDHHHYHHHHDVARAGSSGSAMVVVVVVGSGHCVRKRSFLLLLCAAALLVRGLGHNTRHHHIEITSCTGLCLPTNGQGSHSTSCGGSVGVPAACRALCCLTLWARPERADALGTRYQRYQA